MPAQNYRELLDHIYRTANSSGTAISPLLDAVDGIDYDEATYRPGKDVTTILDIVTHATGWLEFTLSELTGSPGPEHVDWPGFGNSNEDCWDTARHRLHSAVATLHELLNRLCDKDLFSPANGDKATRGERIMNMVIHDAYHAGQIIKIRQIYKTHRDATMKAKVDLLEV